jgi:hypothetical protein
MPPIIRLAVRMSTGNPLNSFVRHWDFPRRVDTFTTTDAVKGLFRIWSAAEA